MSTPPTLLGSYTPPAVRVGSFAYCRFRGERCRVTSWTDAPINWPRVQRPKCRGGSGLLVNATLQRAIRTESAAALMHHFGVTDTTVWRWRKWLGVEGHTKTRGSERLHRETSNRGAAAVQAREWTAGERAARSEAAKLAGRRPRGRWQEDGWTPAELALLGTDHDKVIAKRVGRSRDAVRSKRGKLGIPPFAGE